MILGTGFVFLFFLLSGVEWMQRIALYFREATFRIGFFSMPFQMLFFIIAFTKFILEGIMMNQHHAHFSALRVNDKLRMSSNMYERFRSLIWRGERNFYICGLGVILWFLIIRISVMLTNFREIEKKASRSLAAEQKNKQGHNFVRD